MKIYHTATQEDYNALMIELDKEGYVWSKSKKASSENHYLRYKNETTVTAYSYKVLEYADLAYEKKYNPEIEIIEYEAKKDVKDLNESVLEIIENLAQATNLKSFYSLQKAKHNLDRLIEKWEVEE